MTFVNNLDPDEAPQNVGLHLRSILFDIQIIYQQKKMGRNNEFFENFERNKYLKKLPSMQRVKELLSVNDEICCYHVIKDKRYLDNVHATHYSTKAYLQYSMKFVKIVVSIQNTLFFFFFNLKCCYCSFHISLSKAFWR